MLASDLFDRAQRIMLDETNVRWPLPELCMWLNDAQREVVLQKPNALSKTVVMKLEQGTYQALPGDYLKLLRVVRNITAETPYRQGGRAVRIVSREILDTQSPYWHDGAMTPFKRDVKHVCFDEQDQRAFYVYPGNDGTGSVELVVSVQPAAIKPTGDANELDSYRVPIELQDIYGNALLDFILYRGYAKDAQFAGAAERAVLHYQQFANSLGMKVQLDVQLSPNGPAQVQAS